MSVAPLNLSWATQTHARATSSALGEPDWLTADRLAALERVAELPAEPNQLFMTYLDLRAVDFAAVEPYPPTPAAADAREAELPEGAAALVHVDERAIVAASSPMRPRLPAVIDTLAQVARTSRSSSVSSSRVAARCPLMMPSGTWRVPSTPWASSSTCPPASSCRRPSCCAGAPAPPASGSSAAPSSALGANAHATVFEEQLASSAATGTAGARADSIWWGTTEIDLADGATLDFAGEQDFGPGTAAFVSRQARGRQGRDHQLGRGQRRQPAAPQPYREPARGSRGPRVKQVEIGFGDGKQLFDLTSYTRHIGEDTTSDLLSKGVFTGKSRGYIKGLIDIPDSGRGTDSFLGEFSMLLDANGAIGDDPQPGDRPARLPPCHALIVGGPHR